MPSVWKTTLCDDNVFDEAPETLKEAMRIFFLSVKSGRLLGAKKGNQKNRSMMVQPSRLVDDHGVFLIGLLT